MLIGDDFYCLIIVRNSLKYLYIGAIVNSKFNQHPEKIDTLESPQPISSKNIPTNAILQNVLATRNTIILKYSVSDPETLTLETVHYYFGYNMFTDTWQYSWDILTTEQNLSNLIAISTPYVLTGTEIIRKLTNFQTQDSIDHVINVMDIKDEGLLFWTQNTLTIEGPTAVTINLHDEIICMNYPYCIMKS
jgi:hypothetical protein